MISITVDVEFDNKEYSDRQIFELSESELMWAFLRVDRINMRFSEVPFDVFWEGEPLLGFAFRFRDAVLLLGTQNYAEYEFQDEGRYMFFRVKAKDRVHITCDYSSAEATVELSELLEASDAFACRSVSLARSLCPRLDRSKEFDRLRRLVE